MLTAGQSIDRYELVCAIGEGGMARVWAARQRGKHGFQKLVALKIIHSRYAEDTGFRAMLLDEARIVSAIDHRNVAQIYDLGESEATLYLVMEHVDGQSLFELIAPEKTVPTAVALRIIADACAGLHAVHRLVDASGRSRNVVHRDVSPQNLLLTMNGEVKLIDFGIAHARDRAGATTDANRVKGKIRYMAPEQARRETLGPPTDVFGAGAVLFRMLSGRAPYAAASDIATMQALVANAPPTMLLPAEIPPSVAGIVRRALAPSVAERYASALQMQEAIESVLANEPRAPDVAAWVHASLTPEGLARREALAGHVRLVLPEDSGAPTVRPAVKRPLESEPTIVREPEGKAPGFMDVGALVAKAKAAPTPVPPDRAAEQPPPSRYVPPPVRAWSTKPVKAAVLAIVFVFAVVVCLLLLPRIARERAIAAAREAGFEMTVERAGVDFGGVSLRGITLKALRVPGLTATIQEIDVRGLSASEIRLVGADIRLQGRHTDLAVGLAATLADNRARLAGTPSVPRKVAIAGGRLTWEGILDEGSRLEAADIGVEVDSRSAGLEDLRGSVGRIELRRPQLSLGPWAASFESGGASSRVRVMLDPPVPDGPSILGIWGRFVPVELTMKIPRTPIGNLGLRPEQLGLPASAETDVEADVHVKLPPAAPAAVKGEVVLWRAHPKGFPRPLDIRATFAASGSPGKPLDLEKATIAVGPVIALVTGTVTPHDMALRADIAFKTQPITCEKLAKAEAKGMGPLAASLQALGQATGALKVTGMVNAAGTATFDTADPEGSTVAWTAKDTCGVSIFGL